MNERLERKLEKLVDELLPIADQIGISDDETKRKNIPTAIMFAAEALMQIVERLERIEKMIQKI